MSLWWLYQFFSHFSEQLLNLNSISRTSDYKNVLTATWMENRKYMIAGRYMWVSEQWATWDCQEKKHRHLRREQLARCILTVMVVAAVKNCREFLPGPLRKTARHSPNFDIYLAPHAPWETARWFLPTPLVFHSKHRLTRDGEGVSRRLLTPRNSWQASQDTFAIKFSREPLSPREARETKNLLPGRLIETIES